MNILDIYDLPAVDSPQTGDNIPGNIQTPPNYIPASNYNAVVVILCVLVLITVIIFFLYLASRKTIKDLKKIKPQITEEEEALLNKYRNLNTKNKNVIYDTLTALTENSQNRDNQNDGV